MQINTIDRAKPQKLYFQVLEILKNHIETGEWRVGTRIPTEEQLCSQYNVSRATVRLAIGELVSLGYLKKFQGKGTFVRRRKPGHSITMLTDLNEEWLTQGVSSISRIIESKVLQPDEDIKNHLNLYEEDYCFFISRVIISEGTPAALQKLYISKNLLPDFISTEDIAERPLYSFIESSCGIKIQRVREMADVSTINEKDADILGLGSNIPVLRTRHICYAQGDMPVSFSESLHTTDRHPKSLDFERLRI